MRQKTMSDMTILSSNVARKEPAGPGHLCLIWPRIPDTVWIFTPSNRATSIEELNISLMKAVFLKILKGWLYIKENTDSVPNQLKLLHYAECLALLENCSSGCNPELRRVRSQFLNGQETRIRWYSRPIEGSLAMHILWSILDHAKTFIRIFHRIHRHCLETTPAI